MIRECRGDDVTLLKEQVDRTAANGQETMTYVPCDCGLRFDDVERTVIFPHHYIRTNNEMVLGLAAQGLSVEQIREHLTHHPVSTYSEDTNEAPSDEGVPMTDEYRNEEPTTEAVDPTDTTESTEAEQASGGIEGDSEAADAKEEN